jgi:DMSO/TMAO reductase YedYZ molybdopterin-dependent catalytic subunit
LRLVITRRDLLSFGAFAMLGAPGESAADSAEGDHLIRQGGTPQNLATPLEYFDRLITPTPAFFVRSHFGAPSLDRTRALNIDGDVTTRATYDVDALKRAFKEVTLTAVLQCAGNGRALHRPRVPGLQWTFGAMGQATFTGVRLRDVLGKAGLGKDVAHIRLVGADAPPKPTVPAFIRSVPLARAMDPNTLVAWAMNGEELSLAHGAPLRLVVPGWAGDHWVKWLVGIRAQKDEAEGFFMQTGYRMPIEPVTPGGAVPPEKMKPASTFPVKSIIGRPLDGATTHVGAQEIVGVAFSGDAPIASVEVSIDDGKTFAPAKLEGEAGAGRWQVFRFRFDRTTPGEVRATSRATDKKGNRQPAEAAWNPSGYFWNAYHAVKWQVAP